MKLRTGLLIGILTLTGTLGLAPAASASFHENLIRQIHPDTGTTNDWVELQMFQSGQQFVQSTYIRSYSATGAPLGTSQFPNSNCPSSGIVLCAGDNQRTILIGDQSPVDGVTPDFNAVAQLNLPAPTGAVCFLSSLGTPTDAAPDEAIDCVSYGAFPGFAAPGVISSPTAPFPGTGANIGNPAEPAGLADDTTLERRITPSCPTLLEGGTSGDDSGDSATDFTTVGAGPPRNNATTPTEVGCELLTVVANGTGTGGVTGPGINCTTAGGDCSQLVTDGDFVNLIATPDPGSTFAGFTASSGSCFLAGPNECEIQLDTDRTVTATFNNPTAPPPGGGTTPVTPVITPAPTSTVTTTTTKKKCKKGRKLKRGKCVKKK